MWNHRIKWIAGSTFVAGALLATALASHAQAASPCQAACLKGFRNDTKMCVLENDCGGNFSMCRIDQCGDSTPGPDRASCLAGCRSDRVTCRQNVATCKADAKTGFKACKNSPSCQ
jgi:hypothetical protein